MFFQRNSVVLGFSVDTESSFQVINVLTNTQAHDMPLHISDEFTRNIAKHLSCKFIDTDKIPCTSCTVVKVK